MTPKTRDGLDAIIRGDKQIEELHWKQQDALISRKLIDDGVATEAGLLASSIPTTEATIMILHEDTQYHSATLPKGTEVLVSWREKVKVRNRQQELIDGYIQTDKGVREVRLLVSPRYRFEKRVIPDLTPQE